MKILKARWINVCEAPGGPLVEVYFHTSEEATAFHHFLKITRAPLIEEVEAAYTRMTSEKMISE